MAERADLPQRDRSLEVTFDQTTWLWDAYERAPLVGPIQRRLRCACGGYVVTISPIEDGPGVDVELAVQLHQRTSGHLKWRRLATR